jgi:NAD(P)-dependent dehydrogenase (short-subunit alcohol dehydrogenase family)
MSETNAASWQSSMAVNLIANAELLRGFSKCNFSSDMTRRAIFMSSVAATRGDIGLSAYAASKAALESMVRSAAVELSRKRIAVNAVRLGLMQEGMGNDIKARIGSSAFSDLGKRYPLGLGKGGELGSSILFLLSEEQSWITGSVLSLDGGFSAT